MVQETAATQCNRAQALRGGSLTDPVSQCLRQGGVKDRRTEGGVGLISDAGQQRQQIEFTEWIACVLAICVQAITIAQRCDIAITFRQAFQQHRRLAFVGHHFTRAKQTGGGIEPATETAGRRAIQLSRQHLLQLRGSRLGGKTRRDLVAARHMKQRRRRHPPWLLCCFVAARQTNWSEAPQPGKTRAFKPQQLAAPGGAIATKADSVERQAENGFVGTLFSRHGRDMGMMVLHSNRRHMPLCGEIQRVAAAEEIRMQIVRDDVRSNLQDVEQMLDDFNQHADRGRVVETADVLRNKGFIAARDADCVLQITAQRQHRRSAGRQAHWQTNRARGKATRTTDELRCAGCGDA